MAQVLFAGASMGVLILPLMLFHQIQLMACAALAQRWGARDMSGERDGEDAAAGTARTQGTLNAGKR